MKNISLLFISIIFVCCSGREYTYKQPLMLNDQLQVSTPSAEGMDSLKLVELISKINSHEFKGVHSVLVCRNNKLVLEEYFNGYNTNTPHELYSAGKSIISAIFGLAVDRKLISPETKLLKLFQNYYGVVKNETPEKRAIQLKHLLTMSSGMACGTFGDPKTDLALLMQKSMNPIKTLLDVPMEAEPGNVFVYNDALAVAINYSLSVGIKQDLTKFQDSLFFDPLGIKTSDRNPGFLPRDFLKIGLLYLKKGVWNGKRILSEEWINESTSFKIKPRSSAWFADGYGYFWWLNKFSYKDKKVECIMAIGNGHQALYIIPELNLVVVFTGGNFNNGITWQQPHKMLQEYIINAVQ